VAAASFQTARYERSGSCSSGLSGVPAFECPPLSRECHVDYYFALTPTMSAGCSQAPGPAFPRPCRRRP
jgi:hypothetical protein